MKEKKFRAWNKKTKQYNFYVELYCYLDGSFGCSAGLENDFPIGDTDDFILEQFTGIYDKNGCRYCQNDIVKYKEKNYILILGDYKFELLGFNDPSQDDPNDFFSEEAYKEGQIIGNIHENKELL